MNKIKIGIFFGGRSREREVSFAGGRTVYDNLDKSLFEAVPIFVDSFNQFIVLDWEYVYKGTIRDFYPPVAFLPAMPDKIQLYAESLPDNQKEEMGKQIGQIISPDSFSKYFDIAFLALHGSYGEDGSIQGLLEWYDIPYTGSGITGSAVGINKRLQKQWTQHLNKSFSVLSYQSIDYNRWMALDKEGRRAFMESCMNKLGLPFVCKSANQGSSIGISFVESNDLNKFEEKVASSFFIKEIQAHFWNALSQEDKLQFVKQLTDLKSGLGLPIWEGDNRLLTPIDCLQHIEKVLLEKDCVQLIAEEKETEVLFEPFVRGREFSCIVLRDLNGEVRALPPTEIVKKQSLFDYRSKYLPGLSRKVTPMQVENEILQQIRLQCADLMSYLDFKVYARIDGFLSEDGKIFLNDPNTTSGMMPSSFFFHQAAEIGWSPSEFLTYIIYASLQERMRSRGVVFHAQSLLTRIETGMESQKNAVEKKERVAVIFGGNSFERHISVESGRNVYEKLKSSGKYDVMPIFLDYSQYNIRLFQIPISMLLKDNADDIRDKVMHYASHPFLEVIRNEFSELTQRFVKGKLVIEPIELSIEELAKQFDGVFLALHGRPGEDGTIQKELERVGLYYNGSSFESASLTIDKYRTIQKLKDAGFPVTDQLLVSKEQWNADKERLLKKVAAEFGYPLIAKPHDDGCSAAVIKIKNQEALSAYADLIFAESKHPSESLRKILGIGLTDEFPAKQVFLIEALIQKGDAEHFLEITGGMLSTYSASGEMEFQIFEPSEALSEGDILSLEEKFLAGQGQNITPARYAKDPDAQAYISQQVKEQLRQVAHILGIEGYCRIDAFVRIYKDNRAELIVIEANSLPGMTPATCIYHQAALAHLMPFDFIDRILKFGKERKHKINPSLES